MCDIENIYPVNPSEMDTKYCEYVILFSDTTTESRFFPIEYIDRAKSWKKIVTKFIGRMNFICEDHKEFHVEKNIMKTQNVYRFYYGEDKNSICGVCDTMWCIMGIPK